VEAFWRSRGSMTLIRERGSGRITGGLAGWLIARRVTVGTMYAMQSDWKMMPRPWRDASVATHDADTLKKCRTQSTRDDTAATATTSKCDSRCGFHMFAMLAKTPPRHDAPEARLLYDTVR
jgi:hypothetical protein